MHSKDLAEYCGYQVKDDGELSSLPDIIEELSEFMRQFSSHAMSDYKLFLQGKAEAYREVVDYLERVAPTPN